MFLLRCLKPADDRAGKYNKLLTNSSKFILQRKKIIKLYFLPVPNLQGPLQGNVRIFHFLGKQKENAKVSRDTGLL